jgi:hypothetical protein
MMAFMGLARHEIDDRKRNREQTEHRHADDDPLSAIDLLETAFGERRTPFYVPAIQNVQPLFKNGPYEQPSDCVRTHKRDGSESVVHTFG